MFSAICRWQKNAISVPRQVGTTTALIAWQLWSAHELGQKCLYLSNSARCAMDGHEVALHMLPEETRLVRKNKRHIEFESGGAILFETALSKCINGMTVDNVIIDNAAFIRDLDDVLMHIYPALNVTTGRIVLASCHNTDAKHPFTRICIESDVGLNDFRHLRVTFRESWKGGGESLRHRAVELEKILGKERFIREYGNYPSM